MRTSSLGRDLAITLIVMLLGVAATAGTLALLLGAEEGQVVQGREIDLAGQQRRLAERTALDVARIVQEPDDPTIRDELRDTVQQLHRIHTGLLAGDPDLGLDGTVPATVEALYGPEGSDLEQRLDAFEDAGMEVAESAQPSEAAMATVWAEADGERLVEDLDEVVATLSDTSADEAASRRSLVAAGLIILMLLIAASLIVLALARRAAHRRGLVNDRLEVQLAESEELYRSTVDSLGDGVVILDQHGAVLQLNQVARSILASGPRRSVPSPGENFGDALPQLHHPDGTLLEGADRPAIRALATGSAVVGQVVGLDIGGERRWFRCNANPIDDAGRRSPRVVLTFSEVTAERRMTAELADQERRFRLALENAPIGMALVSSDGRFIEVNQAFCDLTQRSHDTLLDCTFQEITHPEDLDKDLTELRRLLDGEGDSYRIEKRYLTPGGDVVHVLLAVAAVRSTIDGDPYFIAQVVDIGERTRAEQAQLAALEQQRDLVARLTELDRTKTQFVSTISHELRTPLTSALGYLEMLDDGAAGPLTERQAGMVQVVDRNSRRLLALIEDLLSLSRIETDQRRSSAEWVTVEQLVADVVATAAPLAEQQGLELVSRVDPTCGRTWGDQSQLERALLNLLSNAIKFTPPGGSVTIEASTSGVDDPEATITIVDTGIGIPAHEQEQLFTRFFRSSTAYSNAVPGTGLGLVIAAELIEDHGGSIEIDSVEGHGTTVSVSLPLAAAQRCPDPGR